MEPKQPDKQEPLLSREHFEALITGSGISVEVINSRKYRTITEPKELRELGFSRQQSLSVPGLLLPVHCTDGANGLFVYRPDIPRTYEDRRGKRNPDGTFKTRVIKYEMPAQGGVRIDCPPSCRWMLAGTTPLWITEGIKKADALASKGLCAIDLLGVWGFKGKNRSGGVTWLDADWQFVNLKEREVRIVFDSDVMVKREVRAALDILVEILQRKGAHVSAVFLPQKDGEKVGVDDYLLTHSVEELEGLIEGPRPTIKVAAPTVKLLRTAPLTMCRPLSLIDGRAYAAIWPHMEITETEVETNGGIIKLEHPITVTTQRLFVVRDDGRTYGEGADDPIESLGIIPSLREVPKSELLWSVDGLEAYRAGTRPSAASVFERITGIINHFVDFEATWGGQSDMCEMVACYILATWFLDAFNVIGYLWASGEPGSGKTTLTATVAAMSYLGQTISSVSTLATVRDFADYGGTIDFDDCDNLDEKKDKELLALLLSGNRRGCTVTQKEPGLNGLWTTRHVNTYCARVFSAVRLPYGALLRRTIDVPLLKSIDKKRTDKDFAAIEYWPHDRRLLIDDLWALSLSNLPKLKTYDVAVASRSSLGGAALEPWRAILSVAFWLDDQGVSGLWKRIHALAVAYQGYGREIDSTAWPILIIKALMRLLDEAGDTLALGDTSQETGHRYFKSAEIRDALKRIVEDEDLPVKEEWITSDRIGKRMTSLRFQKLARKHGGERGGWRVRPSVVQRHAQAFGLIPADVSPSVNVSPVEEGREEITI